MLSILYKGCHILSNRLKNAFPLLIKISDTRTNRFNLYKNSILQNTRDGSLYKKLIVA